jgi:hypothetical protein
MSGENGEYIEFEIAGVPYWAADAGDHFFWDNDAGEYDNKKYATMAEAQQGAIDWEAGRDERYEGSERQELDLRGAYINRLEEAKEEERGCE